MKLETLRLALDDSSPLLFLLKGLPSARQDSTVAPGMGLLSCNHALPETAFFLATALSVQNLNEQPPPHD
jgi:hypothetical protein